VERQDPVAVDWSRIFREKNTTRRRRQKGLLPFWPFTPAGPVPGAEQFATVRATLGRVTDTVVTRVRNSRFFAKKGE
jgi:hypothetical protein